MSFLAGGFSTPAALSFASAFILVSIGITIFSLTGYNYERLPPEEQASPEEGEALDVAQDCAVKERQIPSDDNNLRTAQQHDLARQNDANLYRDKMRSQQSFLPDRRQRHADIEL